MYQLRFLSSRFAGLLCSIALVACGPSRPPVPPGTVPNPRTPTQSETEYGRKVLGTLTQKYELDNNHPRYQDVLTVVDKLSDALGPQTDPWHVYVLKDASVKNAAATKGNHIFVWTGMIDATRNNNELAAVIGHEMGHILARHTDPDSNESIRQALVGVGAMAAGVAVASVTKDPNIAQNAGKMTAQLSQQVGNAIAVYPYSRTRELEADHIGLFLMADAGYDPQAALSFWQRAAQDPTFSQGLEFFSTHPPAGKRLEQMRALLPRAIDRYQGKGSSPAQQRTNSTTPYRQSSRIDSFDISTMEQLRSAARPQSWQVTNSRAVLFREPSLQSAPLGEFSRGTIVESVSEIGGWVQIRQPDSGYLQSADLVPLID